VEDTAAAGEEPMAAPTYSNRTVVTALSLTVLAGTIFIAGGSRAIAPEQGCLAAEFQQFPPDREQIAEPLDPAQRAVAEHLSRRFLIATEATQRWVAAAYRSAREVGLDPLLVLALISIESRFNPVAESVMGAKGLMQIIPRFHRDKLTPLGGDQAALDPEANIQVGTRILQEYVYRTGTLEAGLQYYNGATSDESAQYAQKVLAERGRLDEMVRAALRAQKALLTNNTTGS
jgi:soluble lytic murein transglycosylase-like protein